jgi:HEPN domain-containing protein
VSPDAASWLAFAEADLHAAKVLLADETVPTRIACFHAQQAGEKAIKTILVADGAVFRRTHDLLVLAALVGEPSHKAIAELDLLVLQPWAVDGRYPGDLPDATAGEGQAAVKTAGDLVLCQKRSPGSRPATRSMIPSRLLERCSLTDAATSSAMRSDDGAIASFARSRPKSSLRPPHQFLDRPPNARAH